jgi:hypothetical protein
MIVWILNVYDVQNQHNHGERRRGGNIPLRRIGRSLATPVATEIAVVSEPSGANGRNSLSVIAACHSNRLRRLIANPETLLFANGAAERIAIFVTIYQNSTIAPRIRDSHRYV